jgi:hypothetical protein
MTMGQKVATRRSRSVRGGDINVGLKQYFQMPKERLYLNMAEVEEWG